MAIDIKVGNFLVPLDGLYFRIEEFVRAFTPLLSLAERPRDFLAPCTQANLNNSSSSSINGIISRAASITSIAPLPPSAFGRYSPPRSTFDRFE